MQNFPPTTHSVPESFLTKFGSYITAVLSGFDRIRFRGSALAFQATGDGLLLEPMRGADQGLQGLC